MFTRHASVQPDAHAGPPPGRRRPTKSWAVLVLACALLLVGAACTKSSTPSSTSSKSATPTQSNGSPSPTSATSGVAAEGIPTYDVSVKNFQYKGMPATVPANQPFRVSFTNKESFPIIHEYVALKLTNGKTAQDVIADAKKKGDKAEDDWIHVGDSGDIETNGSVVMTFDLPPGNYVATCWHTGKAGGGEGPPHVAIGMIASFKATTSAPLPATTPQVPTYDVSVKNFQYKGMPATVPANQPFRVSFTNKESFPIIHEYVALKLTNGKTAQDVIADAKKKGDKAEDDWIHVGDSGDIETNGSVVMTFDLPPGNYVATCWHTGKAGGGEGPPHVAIGMIASFKATTSAPLPATTPQVPTYDVSVKNFQYKGMPATVPANQPFLVSFTNKESFPIIHEYVALKLTNGKTAQDVIADAKKKGDKAEDDWIHVGDSGDIETNGSVVMTFDLPPGNYVATCWHTGKAGGGEGPPHVAIGMIASFTAK